MSEHVLAESSGGVLTLTLNRPEKKNALTSGMYRALGSAIDAAGSDPDVRCVLLRGAGGSFCAGNDLTEFVAVRDEPEQRWEGNPLLTALARARVPLVAAVRGRAVGVGLTMLLHCDLVYLGDDARLSAPFVDLGLVPEAASSLTLPARIGHARAFSMFVLGEVVDAATAESWGLVNEVVPAAYVDARARAAAEAVAARPAEAAAITKALMREPEALEERIASEGAHFVERLHSPEVARTLTALLRRLAGEG